MSDECFPNQFLHPNIRSNPTLGKTKETPKDRSTPELLSLLTIYQQMVHSLPTMSTHATPINKIKPIILRINPSEYLIPSRSPNKKGNSSRSLHSPNTFPRKSDRGRVS